MTGHLEHVLELSASASQQTERGLDVPRRAADRPRGVIRLHGVIHAHDRFCQCRLPLSMHVNAASRFIGCVGAAELAMAAGEGVR